MRLGAVPHGATPSASTGSLEERPFRKAQRIEGH
jgi:hypothetical protein